MVYNNFPWPEVGTTPPPSGERWHEAQEEGEKSASHVNAPALTGTPSSLRGGVVERITQTAQGILDARALYPDSSLADLYDPVTMPPELRKAHRENDRAVMAAYGFAPDMAEPDIVARLFNLYMLAKQAD